MIVSQSWIPAIAALFARFALKVSKFAGSALLDKAFLWLQYQASGTALAEGAIKQLHSSKTCDPIALLSSK